MAGESVLVPPYVRLKPGCTPDADPDNWDAWSVLTSGDDRVDYLTGSDYADIALRKVAQLNSCAPVSFTLTTMFAKILNKEIPAGSIEKGFLDRIAMLAADRRTQLDAN